MAVPTSRPRHVITETDDIAAALRAAEQRWPEDRGSPARLLRRLLLEGHAAVSGQRDRAVAEELDAIDDVSGCLTGVYEPGYLEDLRRDWPA